MNDKPDSLVRNYCFDSMFFPLKNDDSALITASLFLTSDSLRYWCIRLSGAILLTIFWTSGLFWLQYEIIAHACLLQAPSTLLNTISNIVPMPPHKHTFRLFLGCISTSSSTSSNRYLTLFESSYVWFFNSSQYSFNLSVSLKVYCFNASSSHFLSSLDISLN